MGGQELKLLLRAVPKSRIAIEPAASLADAAEAVRMCSSTDVELAMQMSVQSDKQLVRCSS